MNVIDKTVLTCFFLLQGREDVRCVHIGGGVVVRMDQHRSLLKLVDSFAGDLTSTNPKLGGRIDIFDLVLQMVFPGESCDVEVMSDPLSTTEAQCGFTTKRYLVLQHGHAIVTC